MALDELAGALHLSLAELCEACQEAKDVVHGAFLNHRQIIAENQRLEGPLDLVHALGAVDANCLTIIMPFANGLVLLDLLIGLESCR
eukprot:10152301-Prorocentrum_lima.AAC.1